MGNEGKRTMQANDVFSVIPDMLCIIDTEEFIITKVNRVWEEVLGYTAKEIENKRLVDFVHTKYKDDTLASLAKVGVEQRAIEFVNRFRAHNGEYLYIEWRMQPCADEVYVAARDITNKVKENRIIREELQKKDMILREAHYIAQMGRWELDLSTNKLDWSDGIYDIFEVDPESFAASYEAFLGFVHPDDRDLLNDAFTQSVKEKEPYEIVHRLLLKDGKIKWVYEVGRTYYDDQDKPIRSVGTVQDISNLKQTEISLAQGKENIKKTDKLLRDTFDAIQDGVIVLDTDMRIQRANKTIIEWFGVKVSKGKFCYQVLRGLSEVCPECPSVKAMATNKMQMVLVELVTLDKELRTFESYAYPMVDDRNQATGFVLHLRDITRQNLAEKLLKKQLQFEKIIAEISSRFIHATKQDLDEKINHMLELCGRYFAVDRMYLFQFSLENQLMSNTHEWCAKGVSCGAYRINNFPVENMPWLMKQVYAKQIVRIDDVDALPEIAYVEKHELQQQDIQSVIFLPVVRGQHIYGFLGFDAVKAKREWTEKHISLMSIVATIVSEAMGKHHMELDMEQAKEAAEAANVAKSHFLANMSHEIRTPMNGVVGFLDLLENTELTEEQAEYAKNINTSTETLMAVINDILDISKIESGKFEIEEIPFDIRSVVESTVIQFSVKAKEKDIELNVLVKSNVPQKVKGDPIRLRQVINNVVSNAVKFTEKGHVYVEVALLVEDKENLTIECKVQDSGIGMTEETIEKLFKPFVQADTSTTRKYGGTGLGLAISNSIVKMMNGEMSITSQFGKGSITSFTIDLKNCFDEDVPRIADYSVLKGKRIFVVDDHAMNRDIAKVYLEEAGSIVEVADSAASALSRIVKENFGNPRFDMMLVDYHMPGMNGYDLLAALKAMPNTNAIPLILLTSVAGYEEAKQAKKQGFVGYLTKPYKRNDLLKCIATNMEAISSGEACIEEACIDENIVREASSEIIDVEKKEIDKSLAILVVDDNEINKKLLVKLLEINGISPHAVSNGLEAVQACEKQEFNIVFMDCQMPVMDGYEATREIRKSSAIAKQPIIIAMTAYAMAGDRQKCLDAGMDDYVSKPVTTEKVMTMLEKYSQPIDVPHRINLNMLVNRFTTELGFNKEDAEVFIREWLPSVLDLVELIEKQVSQGDTKQATELLHQLKGEAGNLRISEISERAALAEKAAQENDIAKIHQLFKEVKQIMDSLHVK